jgi:hypothetical protein
VGRRETVGAGRKLAVRSSGDLVQATGAGVREH